MNSQGNDVTTHTHTHTHTHTRTHTHFIVIHSFNRSRSKRARFPRRVNDFIGLNEYYDV